MTTRIEITPGNVHRLATEPFPPGSVVTLASDFDGSAPFHVNQQGTADAPIIIRADKPNAVSVVAMTDDAFPAVSLNDSRHVEIHDLHFFVTDKRQTDPSVKRRKMIEGGDDTCSVINCGFWDTYGAIGGGPGLMYGNLGRGIGGNRQEHGIYGQNPAGAPVKRIVQNMFAYTSGYPAHIYGQAGGLVGFEIQDNTFMGAGHMSGPMLAGILVGGATAADDIQIGGNWIYNDRAVKAGAGIILGGAALSNGLVDISDNRLITYNGVRIRQPFKFVAMEGNWFDSLNYGLVFPGHQGVAGWNLHSNKYRTRRPDRAVVRRDGTREQWTVEEWNEYTHAAAEGWPPQLGSVVRANDYDPDRFDVTIDNPHQNDRVRVDMRGFLRPGDEYEVRSLTNYWAAPVVRKFVSGLVSFDMQSAGPVAVAGYDDQPDTLPDFGAFVVRRLASGNTEPEPPTPPADNRVFIPLAAADGLLIDREVLRKLLEEWENEQ